MSKRLLILLVLSVLIGCSAPIKTLTYVGTWSNDELRAIVVERNDSTFIEYAFGGKEYRQTGSLVSGEGLTLIFTNWVLAERAYRFKFYYPQFDNVQEVEIARCNSNLYGTFCDNNIVFKLTRE